MITCNTDLGSSVILSGDCFISLLSCRVPGEENVTEVVRKN